MVKNRLTKLLKEAGEAHHKAFVKEGGKDPHWENWYAKYLIKHSVEGIIGDTSVSLLSSLLLECNDAYLRSKSNLPWEEYYAVKILDNNPLC